MAGVRTRLRQAWSMKKYIRDVLDDLTQKRNEKTRDEKKRDEKDYIPPVPAAPTDGKIVGMDAAPAPVAPCDLENQDLSSNPAQRVRQLDQQAQDDEERETLE
jgi:hypothetical protein